MATPETFYNELEFESNVYRRLQDDDEEGESDSSIILRTFRVYGSMYGICILLFTILNWRYPRLFNIRSWSPVQRCKLASEIVYDNCVSWFWQVFSVSDIDLHEQCGMDAVCFIRALRFGRQIVLMGCLNAVWLIPLYYTAEGPLREDDLLEIDSNNSTVQTLDFFQKISIGNMPPASKRYVGTLVATYVNFLFTMYLIIQEYKWYTAHRHKWLSETSARNYAVYVSGIPNSYRSNTALESYFTQCCGKNSVLEAQIIRDTPKLDKLVAKRTALVHRLEHCAAVERRTGQKLRHRNPNNWRMVSTIDSYRAQLADLNRTIQRNIANMTASQDPLRMHMARAESNLDHLLAAIQEDVQNDGAETITLQTTAVQDPKKLSDVLPNLPGQSSRRLALGAMASDDEDDDANTILKDDCTIVQVTDKKGGVVQAVIDEEGSLIQVLDGDEKDDPTLKRDDSGLAYMIRRNLLNGTYKVVGDVGAAVVTGAGTGFRVAGEGLAVAGNGLAVAGTQLAKGGAYAGVETLRVARDVGANVITSAGAVAPILLNQSEGTPREAGFVVFNDLYAAQLALQMIHHPKPYVMTVSPAPDPADIFWRNVGIPHHAKRSGILMAIAAASVLCFFWSVPMAFVSSLTEVKSLKESLPKLGEFMDKNGWTEGFFAQLAPLILLFFNEVILPVVLKYFATWEGHISSAVLEASLFNKLGCFMIIQTFFVGAISGSVTQELEKIIDDPESLLTLLASSLPAQSSFFIQISLAMTFFLMSIEMLRLYPLCVAWLRRCFGPHLTTREKRRNWGILHPLENPPDFWHAETFAQLILFYMVFFVYNAIAPATNFFLLLCFLLTEAGYRYQFIHNYPRAFDTGGKLWRTFILFTLVNMVIAQLTLLGLLALEKSGIGGSGILPLLTITLLFSFFLYSKHSEVAQHLPTRNCILKDSENNAEAHMDMKFVKSAFTQPSLQRIIVEAKLDDDEEDGAESTWSQSKSRTAEEV